MQVFEMQQFSMVKSLFSPPPPPIWLVVSNAPERIGVKNIYIYIYIYLNQHIKNADGQLYKTLRFLDCGLILFIFTFYNNFLILEITTNLGASASDVDLITDFDTNTYL